MDGGRILGFATVAPGHIEIEGPPADYRAQAIISRVPQRLPTARRVEIWLAALEGFLKTKPAGRLFDLDETGRIVAWCRRPNR